MHTCTTTVSPICTANGMRCTTHASAWERGGKAKKNKTVGDDMTSIQRQVIPQCTHTRAHTHTHTHKTHTHTHTHAHTHTRHTQDTKTYRVLVLNTLHTNVEKERHARPHNLFVLITQSVKGPAVRERGKGGVFKTHTHTTTT